MRLAALIIVAALGVGATIAFAVRMHRATRGGAPRELVLGYLALMVAAAALSLLVLRVL